MLSKNRYRSASFAGLSDTMLNDLLSKFQAVDKKIVSLAA